MTTYCSSSTRLSGSLIDWRDSSCSRSRFRLCFHTVVLYYNGYGKFSTDILREDPCKDADLIMLLPAEIPSVTPHPLSTPYTTLQWRPFLGWLCPSCVFYPSLNQEHPEPSHFIAVQPILETEWEKNPRKCIKFSSDLLGAWQDLIFPCVCCLSFPLYCKLPESMAFNLPPVVSSVWNNT